MVAHIICFLGIYLITLLFLWGIGRLLLNSATSVISVSGFFTEQFLSLFAGFVVVVTTYSLIKSGLNTIAIFIPLLFAALFYKTKIELKTSVAEQKVKTKSRSKLAAAACLALLPFAYFCCIVLKVAIIFLQRSNMIM